jgi:hypothetical protein
MEQLMLINQRLLVQSAGFQATNAYNSTFIGSSAGSGAIILRNSNFFGRRAGQEATNAGFRHLLVIKWVRKLMVHW